MIKCNWINCNWIHWMNTAFPVIFKHLKLFKRQKLTGSTAITSCAHSRTKDAFDTTCWCVCTVRRSTRGCDGVEIPHRKPDRKFSFSSISLLDSEVTLTSGAVIKVRPGWSGDRFGTCARSHSRGWGHTPAGCDRQCLVRKTWRAGGCWEKRKQEINIVKMSCSCHQTWLHD